MLYVPFIKPNTTELDIIHRHVRGNNASLKGDGKRFPVLLSKREPGRKGMTESSVTKSSVIKYSERMAIRSRNCKVLYLSFDVNNKRSVAPIPLHVILP